MARHEHVFPRYTRAEIAADGVIHVFGLAAGIVAASWLVIAVSRTDSARLIAATGVYAAGLIGVLSSSAAYHLTRPGLAKAVLRHIDLAMIFVMIAGSYTPFALNALPLGAGVVLCVVVWSLAAGGIALKLLSPRLFERYSLPLYLGMGWLVLGALPSLMARLPDNAMVLLAAGGVVYSLGAVVHTRERMPFHNAIWHALVLVGAGLHLASLAATFLPGA
jgi:hemolysin III